MTAPQQPEPGKHCGHECVCMSFSYNKLQKFARPCVIDTCQHDTRPHNPAPAIISIEPHPPGKEQLACDNTCPARCPGCEDTCPLWEHDEQVKREAREEVLNEMRDLVRNAKKYGTIEPEELFHWTGIIAMIDSLRSEAKKP